MDKKASSGPRRDLLTIARLGFPVGILQSLFDKMSYLLRLPLIKSQSPSKELLVAGSLDRVILSRHLSNQVLSNFNDHKGSLYFGHYSKVSLELDPSRSSFSGLNDHHLPFRNL